MKAAVGIVLLTAALAAPPVAADLRVWTERDQQGDERRIRRTVRDLRNLGWDDRISSLQADERWLVCSEPLFRGDCRVVEGTVPNLRVLGLNNRITSMRKAPDEVPASPELPPPEPAPRKSTPPKSADEPPPHERAPVEKPSAPSPAPSAPPPAPREWWEGAGVGTRPQLELFEKPNYEGRRLRLEREIADTTVLDQPVGSLLVRAGAWQVCSRPRFRGQCRTLDTSGEGLAETKLVGSLRPEPE
jgi:hypothetical protein